MEIREVARLLDERIDQYEAITPQRFQAIVANLKGAKIATLLAKTIPSGFRKTKNPFWGDCYKIQRLNVVINPSDTGYEDSVNRQLTKEDKPAIFKAESRVFGTKLHTKPIIAHINKSGQGKFYLWVKSQNVLSFHYVDSDGKLLPSQEVEKFIPVKNESMRQGTDKPTIVRNFTMENIIGIVIDGHRYIIE